MVVEERELHVLVVDEDRQNLALVVEVLRGEGFSVEACASGVRAQAALRTRDFDLVVAEATMVALSGLELLRSIRNDPERADLPVLLLSASPAPALRREAQEAGATAYLEKPFRVFDLADRARRLARPRRSENAPSTLLAIRLRRAKQDLLSELPSGVSFRPALRRALMGLAGGEAVSLVLIRLDDPAPSTDRSAWTAVVGALASVLHEASAEGKLTRPVFRLDDGELAWLSLGDRRGELVKLLDRALTETSAVSGTLPLLPMWIIGVVVEGPYTSIDADRVLRLARSLLVRARREGVAVLVDEVREQTIPDSRSAPSSNKKPDATARRVSSAPPRKPKPPP